MAVVTLPLNASLFARSSAQLLETIFSILNHDDCQDALDFKGAAKYCIVGQGIKS